MIQVCAVSLFSNVLHWNLKQRSVSVAKQNRPRSDLFFIINTGKFWWNVHHKVPFQDRLKSVVFPTFKYFLFEKISSEFLDADIIIANAGGYCIGIHTCFFQKRNYLMYWTFRTNLRPNSKKMRWSKVRRSYSSFFTVDFLPRFAFFDGSQEPVKI